MVVDNSQFQSRAEHVEAQPLVLRKVGLRPTRQRMELGWILYAKGDRHLTAEMLFEEASKAKVPVSLAT